jgi:hypothetical protein
MTFHLHPVLRLRLRGAVSHLHLDAFVALVGATLPLPLLNKNTVLYVNARFFFFKLKHVSAVNAAVVTVAPNTLLRQGSRSVFFVGIYRYAVPT